MAGLAPGGWVRPLGLEETLLAAYNTTGNMTIAHALWLSSTTPLTHSNISNALWALYRAVPSLRLCVRTNPDTKSLWFHSPETASRGDVLDLQEVRGQRFSSVYQQVLHKVYPLHRGPLWCLHYLNLQHNIDDSYQDPDEEHPQDYCSSRAQDEANSMSLESQCHTATSNEATRDEYSATCKETFENCWQVEWVSKGSNDAASGGLPSTAPSKQSSKYGEGVSLEYEKPCADFGRGCDRQGKNKYIIIFGFSHVITDGVSNMRISHHFLELLNQELRSVVGEDDMRQEREDVEEVGVFTSPVAEEQALERKKRDSAFATGGGLHATPAIYMALYPPHTRDPAEAATETVFLPGLSVGQTAALRQQCRDHGVTVHAAFTAAAALAMLRLLADASEDSKQPPGKLLETLTTFHDVNMRRYWQQPAKDVMGLHAAILELSIPTPDDGRFWAYANQLHILLKQELNEQVVLQQVVCDFSCQAPEQIIMEGHDPSLTRAYFGVTNLGDLTVLLPGTAHQSPAHVTPADMTCGRHSKKTGYQVPSHDGHSTRPSGLTAAGVAASDVVAGDVVVSDVVASDVVASDVVASDVVAGSLAGGGLAAVYLTRVHHSTTCHSTGVVCQHLLHTFRGRLLYNLDYFTDKMRRQEAIKYAHLTLHLLLGALRDPS